MIGVFATRWATTDCEIRNGAEGGNRTRTTLSSPRILSPHEGERRRNDASRVGMLWPDFATHDVIDRPDRAPMGSPYLPVTCQYGSPVESDRAAQRPDFSSCYEALAARRPCLAKR